MAQGAFNLLDHVLPEVPLRQWVLTVPHELRHRLAYDRRLLADVGRLFVSSVLRFYQRRMRGARTRNRGPSGSKSGAVLVVQRTSADLKLNPHYHAIFLDGVYELDAGGQPVFSALSRLSTSELADALTVIRVRILAHLKRHGVIEADPVLTIREDGLAEREPALAQLATAAVSGASPAGPELRRRPHIPLRGRPGIVITAPLALTEMGFSLHAATHAGAHDLRARAALVKYILRPPIADEHLRILPDDLVRIQLKRPFRDGTVAVDLDPLSLLARLAAAIPAPRQHTVRYAGVLGAASKWRALVVPPPPAGGAAATEPVAPSPNDPGSSSSPPTHRCTYRPWLELLRRTFAIDLTTCARCGGPTKVIALVRDPDGIARFLRHLGEPTEPPPLAPARAPPYFQSRVLRRRPAEQAELFER
jgi:Putative transposase